MTHRWTIEELLAYASGELDAERAHQVERALATDPAAAAVIDRYRMVRQLVHTDDSVAPTARAIGMAAALFESRAQSAIGSRQSAIEQPGTRPIAECRMPIAGSSRPTWLDRLDAVIADLLFDSRLQPIAVRRGPASDLVQLAYKAVGLEIELRASWTEGSAGADGMWRIMGQVAVERGEPDDLRASVALVVSGGVDAIGEATCDETGIFALDAPPGGYDLCIRLPGGEGRTIVLPQIELP